MAKTKFITSVQAENPQFENLAVAVAPSWHKAIIKLAKSTERLADKLELVTRAPLSASMAPAVRALTKEMIDWLDQLEDTDTDSAVDDESCDTDDDREPSLGSFDGVANQVHAWSTNAWQPELDAELDQSDNEPSLGSLNNFDQSGQQGGTRDLEDEPEHSGVADAEGLLEQCGHLYPYGTGDIGAGQHVE